jgi:hypothetical protein
MNPLASWCYSPVKKFLETLGFHFDQYSFIESLWNRTVPKRLNFSEELVTYFFDTEGSSSETSIVFAISTRGDRKSERNSLLRNPNVDHRRLHLIHVRVVIASWLRWWKKRHYELNVRPVGDCKVMFFSWSNRSRVASVGERPNTCIIALFFTQIYKFPAAFKTDLWFRARVQKNNSC